MTKTSRYAPQRRASCRLLAWGTVAVAAFALAGCHRGLLKEHSCNKPQPYSSARSIPPLKVPSGVDAPDTHAALKIPPLNEPAPPARSLRAPCLDEPPPFTPGGAPGRRVPSA